jgi:ribosomal-protein-alanine N-acetyltransferase
MSGGHRVRAASCEDLKAVLAIERVAAEAPHWSEAAWRKALAQEGTAHAVFVAESVEGIRGFVVASCIDGMAELESVAVAAADRGQGIGRELCRQAMTWASAQSAEQMELEVRASNAGAQALYYALGFAEQGRRAKYYNDPVEDAVLMVARLAGVSAVA